MRLSRHQRGAALHSGQFKLPRYLCVLGYLTHTQRQGKSAATELLRETRGAADGRTAWKHSLDRTTTQAATTKQATGGTRRVRRSQITHYPTSARHVRGSSYARHNATPRRGSRRNREGCGSCSHLFVHGAPVRGGRGADLTT